LTFFALTNTIQCDDDLVARCICPADLLQFPCRWDELPGGCQMLRLCSVSLTSSFRNIPRRS
jgi:hypothetical protein